ncbi:hypothetical protein [Streptomyces sp. FH025]|uniref:hypothetical protein n=1 Tax=Streptomyces sp. FH025 TaxID=2815937 RepID=UPI001A9EB512|nr:hypothetical protein [Streptomyces sp. FH025]MBO1418545.1 hypothetical protein [Streptomyces sp. FH025]
MDSASQSTPRALTGRYRAVRPRVGSGAGHPPAEHVETATGFAFRAPSLWRLDLGGRIVVRDGNRAPWVSPGLSFPGTGWPWNFDPDPARLVMPGLPEDVMAGRRGRCEGREAVLTEGVGPGDRQLHLVIDRETGIVLRASAPGTAYVEELADLEFPESLPEEQFVEPECGPDRPDRWERISEYYRTRPLPVPASWPGPLGRLSPIDGDPDTGFLVLDLDTRPASGAPGAAQLVRQPLADQPYLSGWALNPGHHLHRWRDTHWQWTLILADHPLTVEQLDRIREELGNAG